MKKIGIIGGLGPEATIDYYKEIISMFEGVNGHGSFNYPEIIIYSVSLGKLLDLFEKKEYDEAADYLAEAVDSLKKAGADFAALSANTPHLLFDRIQERTDIPMLSIVEACAEEAKTQGVRKCALLGTGFTMKNTFYHDVFDRYGLQLEVPGPEQIDFIHDKVFSEMEKGVFKDETRADILDLIAGMKEEKNIDSVILGCTEFPIMFREEQYFGLPFLNTTRIHVEAIVRECLRNL